MKFSDTAYWSLIARSLLFGRCRGWQLLWEDMVWLMLLIAEARSVCKVKSLVVKQKTGFHVTSTKHIQSNETSVCECHAIQSE